MKLKLIVVACCYLLLSRLDGAQSERSVRDKREALRARQVVGDKQSLATAIASDDIQSNRLSSLADSGALLPEKPPIGNKDDGPRDELKPAPRPPWIRKPARPPAVVNQQDRYEPDEDRDEGWYESSHDYDYRKIFHLATDPIRHMNRMMSDVLDQAFGFAEGTYDGSGHPGASVASSSAFANSDGYSRLSSSVSNNGRTRGIVSETRNGRTRTRRIGDDDRDGSPFGYSDDE